MKRLIEKWLGITAEREASNELIGQYRDEAAKARAELDEVRHAAIEAWQLEVSRLKHELNVACKTIASLESLIDMYRKQAD